MATSDLNDVTLGDAISDAGQPFAFPDTPSGVVADLIIESGVGRIPIVDRPTRRVIGILTRHDLLKARQASRASESERGGFFRSSRLQP